MVPDRMRPENGRCFLKNKEDEKIIKSISESLSIPEKNIMAVLTLFEEGSTVPFIARYRKEMTGSLDETVIQAVKEKYDFFEKIEKRKQYIKEVIEKKDSLTDEIALKIDKAEILSELEDIYLPYKSGRKTRAAAAKEKGLLPFAESIISGKIKDPVTEAEKYINPEKGVEKAADALKGASDIIAEKVNENTDVRKTLRGFYVQTSLLTSSVIKKKKEEASRFRDYFEYSEKTSKAAPHRILAVLRGKNNSFLTVKIEVDEERAISIIKKTVLSGSIYYSAASYSFLEDSIKDSFSRLLHPSLENEIISELREKADDASIAVFSENLKNLLLDSPFGNKPVIAVDPGIRTGCKAAAVDETGKFLDYGVIFPFDDKKRENGVDIIKRFHDKYNIEAVAVGNGTGGREVFDFLKSLSFLKDMACQGWLHGKEPAHTLGFNRLVKTVRERMENDSRYFEKLIEERLLKNSHRSTVTVKPESNDSNEEDKYIPQLDPDQFAADTELFEKYRDSKDSDEDLKKIPVLEKGDIPEKVLTIDYKKGKINSSDCYYHDFFTAGIVYTDLFYDIRGMDESLKMYIPLFARSLRETGIPGVPFYEIARELSLKTGGFFVFPETGKAFDSSINEYLVVRYKAIEERFKDASSLVFSILEQADFDDLARLKDIINELKSDFMASILRRGNYVVSLEASKKISRSLKRQAGWAGAEQLLFLSGIDTENKNVIKDTAEKLKKIQKWIMKKSSVTAGITSDKSCFSAGTEILSKYINNPPSEKTLPVFDDNSSFSQEGRSYEALIVPSLVNFNASVIKASRTGTEEFIYEKLLTRIIDTGFLWEKVRMENGAYGVGSAVNGMEGILSFSSYRDPSVKGTQDAFRDSLKYIIDGNLTEDELFKAVINCIGKEIKPLSPGEKGHVNIRRHLYSLSDEVRQKNREIMLKAKTEDIIKAAERLYNSFNEVSMCSMCGNETIESYGEYFSLFQLKKTELPV